MLERAALVSRVRCERFRKAPSGLAIRAGVGVSGLSRRALEKTLEFFWCGGLAGKQRRGFRDESR